MGFSSGLLDEAIRLPEADRLEFIGAVWDSIDHHSLGVTEDEARMLDECSRDYAKNPTAGRPWDEVKAELGKRLQW